MGKAYKNFWSLNTDEAVVSGILRDETPNDLEILMPMNAQMKGIDLVLMNINTKKSITLQVKGSRAFEPKKIEVARYGQGNAGWFYLDEKIIFSATADYFIFLIYVLEEHNKLGRRIIRPHSIVLPTKKLQALTKKHKTIHGSRYSYYFWINPKTKKAFEFRDEFFYVTEFLDKKGFKKLNSKLS